ncbi:MAG: hypothetical protein JXK07_10545 [Spirochaetes bacterium]|nr:hypothetical protein [Spirochaetota bacterium]MBN2769296.1 hypothetical protein [Spirochaetota bacterium]
MDYRLVKQFLNDAIDNFFNFFYKLIDFGKVIIDTFWAFMEIWYNFFMFFINIFLYGYYLLLFVIDRMTMSSAPIFFWRTAGRATRQEFKRAYDRNLVIPVSGAYGKGSSRSAVASAASSVSSAVSSGASSVSGAAASSVAMGKYSAKPNFIIRFFALIGRAIVAVIKGIGGAFCAIGRFFTSRLVPVKEKPVGRKNLVEDYLKQYDSRKSR